MDSFFKRLIGRSLGSPRDVPVKGAGPLPPQQRTAAPTDPAAIPAANSDPALANYPKVFRAVARHRQQIDRPEVFEPALAHYSRAFRLGEPAFDRDVRHEWFNTRRSVIDYLLKVIMGSRWADHLVLRGSLLLKAWMGDAAREPGDIDWVFRPSNVAINDPAALELFEGMIEKVSRHPHAGNAVIDASRITVDEIWTYERASGRRIVFPWSAEGLPPGEVQMDVVFGEDLFTEPIQAALPTPTGSLSVWAASKEISLAWKLLWLETDIYPQGKDLYDATLLAEQTQLPLGLLLKVMESGDRNPATPLLSDFPMHWDLDWENFKLEYPWIEGEAHAWQTRLTQALAPTFEFRESV